MSSQPSTTPSGNTAARERPAPSQPAGALAGRGGLIASVGAALLGFGLAGVSAAGPIQLEPLDRTAATGTASATPSAEADPTVESAAAAAQADAEEARASTARRADRSARSAPTPTPSKTAAPRATTKPAPAWVHPMPGAEVTSCYGTRWGRLHAGIDLSEAVNTPIRAAAAGTVEAAGWVRAGYGISVLIDHGNGYLTHYGHMKRTAVESGETVKAGEVIGYEGSTGHSTGPHLHFEVHRGAWNQIDPAPWMRARGVDLGC